MRSREQAASVGISGLIRGRQRNLLPGGVSWTQKKMLSARLERSPHWTRNLDTGALILVVPASRTVRNKCGLRCPGFSNPNGLKKRGLPVIGFSFLKTRKKKSMTLWDDLVFQVPSLFIPWKYKAEKYLWHNVYLNSNFKKALYKSYKHSLTLLLLLFTLKNHSKSSQVPVIWLSQWMVEYL